MDYTHTSLKNLKLLMLDVKCQMTVNGSLCFLNLHDIHKTEKTDNLNLTH